MQNMPSILSPDFGLLFWMLIAFLVVFVLLLKFGFPIIVNMVENRKQYIDESLKSAREANEKLANIKVESEGILKAAYEQQAEILKDAMATRDRIVSEAREKAQVEGQKLLEEAKNPVKVDRITGDVVKGKYVCPNHRCITTTEQELEQAFKYDKDNNVYRCIYCETEAR